MGGRSTVVGFRGSPAGGAAGSGVATEAGNSGEDAKGEDSNESSEERAVGSLAGFSADGGDCNSNGFVSSTWGC